MTLFLIKVGVIYAAWQLLYDFILLPNGRLDTFLSFTGVRHASWLLSALGWEIETTDRFISCAGKRRGVYPKWLQWFEFTGSLRGIQCGLSGTMG